MRQAEFIAQYQQEHKCSLEEAFRAWFSHIGKQNKGKQKGPNPKSFSSFCAAKGINEGYYYVLKKRKDPRYEEIKQQYSEYLKNIKT